MPVPTRDGPTDAPRVHARPQVQAAPHVHAQPQVQGATFVQTKVGRSIKQNPGAKTGELRTGAVVRRPVEGDIKLDEVTDEGWSSDLSEVTPAWQKQRAAVAAAAAAAATVEAAAAWKRETCAEVKPATPQEVADDLLMEALGGAVPASDLKQEDSIDAMYADGANCVSAPPSAPGPGGRAGSPTKGAYVVRKTEKPEQKPNGR